MVDSPTVGARTASGNHVVPFDRVRESLSDPTPVSVSDDVTLETLHLAGPGPTLVFVHGGLGSLWNPYPQLQALRGDRGVVVYSLAGNCGSADRPAHTLDGHVADLRRLLDELGVDDPVVHGHSYGSTVALEYAKRHAVAGLVVAGGGDHDLAARFEGPLLAAIRTLRLHRLPVPAPLGTRLVANAACHPETPRAVAREFYACNPVPSRRSAFAAPAAFRGYDGHATGGHNAYARTYTTPDPIMKKTINRAKICWRSSPVTFIPGRSRPDR